MAIRGLPAILGCEFPSDSNSDLVVTWQLVENSKVVHSFYYQKDQLALQDAHYKNRTNVFLSELKKGNASLRIYPVGPKDTGWYLCTVSNTKGSGKAQVQLEYGGMYDMIIYFYVYYGKGCHKYKLGFPKQHKVGITLQYS